MEFLQEPSLIVEADLNPGYFLKIEFLITLVGLKSADQIDSVDFRKLLILCREVGAKPEDEKAEENSDEAFDDENPIRKQVNMGFYLSGTVY